MFSAKFMVYLRLSYVRIWEAAIRVVEVIAGDGKSLAKDLWRSWSISPSIAKRAEERHIDHICSI